MADQVAKGAEQSPESRLLGVGFTRRLEFWCPPGEERARRIGLQRIAGEVQPDLPSWPGVHPDALVGFQVSSEGEVDRMLHPPPAAEPQPLPGWAEPWAELLAEKLKPVVRAEIRAAMRADARKRATT